MNYLNDLEFLKKLDNMKLRTTYARITMLDFRSEEPVAAIEGRVTGGNISVSSTSRIRRSINLQMISRPEYNNIEDVDNLISINRKMLVEIGIENPFKNSGYDDVVWFRQGIFIVSTANVSKSTSGWRINVTGKDKMATLNGTCGGTLSGVTRFDMRNIEQEDGRIISEKVPIFSIILEAVHHLGGEKLDNIIINDLPDYGLWILKYSGSEPIYFANDYSTLTNSLAEAISWGDVGYTEKNENDDVGYEETPLVYPGELIFKAGDNVTMVLDKIVEQLQNYEYFYDVDGRFIFQQIRNYTNTASPYNDINRYLNLGGEDYIQNYSNTRYQYSLSDQQSTTQVTKSPNYDNIKNDFLVWGIRELPTGGEVNICYHLAIDEKPEINMAKAYFWSVLYNEKPMGYTTTNTADEPEDITYTLINHDDNGYQWEIKHYGILIGYIYTDTEEPPTSGFRYVLSGKPCSEWREEMYRQAAAASYYGDTYSDYDAELLAYWRDIYDTTNEKWEATNSWNPAVYDDPSSLVYWLDFIDDSPALNRYSVSTIGRRTKVENNNKVSALFYKTLPDVIFIDDPDDETLERYEASGQKYFITNDKYNSLFVRSLTGVSAFDCIRDMLYRYLIYNTTIQISCIPKYYLECNSIMYIYDPDIAIDGNYCINSFTIPLIYNGLMNISLSEVLVRV